MQIVKNVILVSMLAFRAVPRGTVTRATRHAAHRVLEWLDSRRRRLDGTSLSG